MLLIHTLLDLLRERVLKVIFVLSLCHVAFSVLLFTLGGVGESLYGDTSGLKYYAGAYYAATLVLLPAIMGFVITYRGIQYDSTAQAAINFGWLMRMYWLFLAITTLVDIISVIIAGIAGVCSGDDCIYKSNTSQNNGMAIAIIVTLLGLLLTKAAAGSVTLYFSEECFGVTLLKRGPRRIAVAPTREAVTISQSTTQMHNFQVQNRQVEQQPERHLTPTAPPPSY